MFSEDLEKQPLIDKVPRKSTKSTGLFSTSILPTSCVVILLFFVSLIAYWYQSIFDQGPILFTKLLLYQDQINRNVCSLDVVKPSRCDGMLIEFNSPATTDGEWPDGFTWSVYEDHKQDKLVEVYNEDGVSVISSNVCRSFSKNICLSGQYILTVNKLHENDVNTKYYVDIVNNDLRVYAGEAYSFNTNDLSVKPSEDQKDKDFNNPDPIDPEHPPSINITAFPTDVPIDAPILSNSTDPLHDPTPKLPNPLNLTDVQMYYYTHFHSDADIFKELFDAAKDDPDKKVALEKFKAQHDAKAKMMKEINDPALASGDEPEPFTPPIKDEPKVLQAIQDPTPISDGEEKYISVTKYYKVKGVKNI